MQVVYTASSSAINAIATLEDTEASYTVLRRVATLEVDLKFEAWKTTQRILSQVNPKVSQADLNQLLDRSLVGSLEENGFLPEMRKRLGN